MNSVAMPERRLVATPAFPPSAAVQQLWFAAQQRPWSTLAIVAAHGRDGAFALAEALVAVGRLTDSGEVDLLNGQGGGLADVAHQLGAMAAVRARGAQMIVVTDPVVVSPVALPLLRAADAVVLVLTLGRSQLAAAERTLDLVGRERVIGCALFSPGVFP
jgi:hypothetical protein